MITKPMVHLNGTSREALERMYEDAGRALFRAIEAMGEAAPNARDYYPLGDSAFRDASTEHNARVARLRDVLADIQEIHEHVANG